jgi:hypothetical protein
MAMDTFNSNDANDETDSKELYHATFKEGAPNDADAKDMSRMGKDQQFKVSLGELVLGMRTIDLYAAHIQTVDHDHVHFYDTRDLGSRSSSKYWWNDKWWTFRSILGIYLDLRGILLHCHVVG